MGFWGFSCCGGSARVESRDPAADPGDKPPLALGLRWLLLAFVPSALLLNVTLHINTDVATSPVFWVVPLSLYLLSFVVVFSRRQLVRHHRTLALQPIGLVVLTMCFSTGQLLLNVIVHLSAFFLIALTCHGALAKSRPGVRYLTQFYLWLSFGGLLGGVFAGVVAPLVFDSLLEYPLMLALACVLGSKFIPGFSKDAFWDVVLALGLGGLFLIQDYYTRSLRFDPGVFGETAVATVFGLMLYSFRKRPYRLGLGIVAILLPAQLLLGDQALEQKRSFYGVHRVLTDGHYQILTHGTTIHGAEHRLAARQREPLTYYYSGGPLGQMFEQLGTNARFERVGIVGLGAGSIACYRQSTQARYTFFEIDPVVVEIATNPAFFRFLSLCDNNVEVVLGDGRRSLSLIEDDTFDLLILDAFSSDAIPTHLLTREALSLYIRKLSPQGVLMIHLSNRNLNLEPVLAALVEDANLSSLIQHHEPPEGGDPYWWKSTWAVVGRTLHDIELLGADHRWQPLASRAHRTLWTDDYSNVLGAIDWGASFGSRSD